MAIDCINVLAGVGAPDVGWIPIGNSVTMLAGDVVGETTGGLAGKLTGSGTAITAAGGIFGFAANGITSDSSGRVTTPSAPSGVDPGVPAILPLPSYSARVPPAAPIAGTRRSQVQCWLASGSNYFIQRHKAGTRVNDSLCGLKCDLTWNSTTSEWEVDSTVTTIGEIVIAPAGLQLVLWKDNRTLWDSSTYATDTYNAWVVFQVLPTLNASKYGLRYASIT